MEQIAPEEKRPSSGSNEYAHMTGHVSGLVHGLHTGKRRTYVLSGRKDVHALPVEAADGGHAPEGPGRDAFMSGVRPVGQFLFRKKHGRPGKGRSAVPDESARMIAMRVGDDDVRHVLRPESHRTEGSIQLPGRPVKARIHQRHGFPAAQKQHVQPVAHLSVRIETRHRGLLLIGVCPENGRIQILFHKGNDPGLHLSQSAFMKRNLFPPRGTCCCNHDQDSQKLNDTSFHTAS